MIIDAAIPIDWICALRNRGDRFGGVVSVVKVRAVQGKRLMAAATIEIPDDAFAILNRSPNEPSQEIRLAAAMIWYTQARMSHKKARIFRA